MTGGSVAPGAAARTTSPFHRHPRALSRSVPAGIVVLGPLGDEPLSMTGPAADLWEVLRAPCSMDEAAATLAERFGTDLATVRRDLDPIWRALRTAGAIVPV